MVDILRDIVYLNVLGRHMIILGSYAAVSDLLEKRSANYSDRPRTVMGELCIVYSLPGYHIMAY
ncbi:hypothetical protein DICSQDRAFT_72425 [Dichomitus squalens LYAD-421 SS1]|uniref:Uncharacterized protein n=1 Tax=Dichomitus squalens (strain LYAD-421) TaxID=732165 RepID=R7SJP7_DICSQ|nr:uncharacterized protein DICSQDRAFT_72425 [Dichomitus squalens LYAD-421 SS1]EJF55955.1 hypothetical protein DICSQDRAFT_72425 [Dichomitus squalens LYAD-421 SS1]